MKTNHKLTALMKGRSSVFTDGELRKGALSVLLALATGAGSLGFTLRAADVPADTANLKIYLDTRTNAGDYDFNLLGDVTMGGQFNMDVRARQTVSIDGAYDNGTGTPGRALVKRTGLGQRFYIPSPVAPLTLKLTLKNAEILGSGPASIDDLLGSCFVAADNVSLDFSNTIFRNNHHALVFEGSTGTTVNLDNAALIGNASLAGDGYAAGLTIRAGSDVTVTGDVRFLQNRDTGGLYTGGAVGVHSSTLTFAGKTTFEGNYNQFHGGAVQAFAFGVIFFKDDAVFRENYSTRYYGGALDLWGEYSFVTFEKDVYFSGNYVKDTHDAGAYGVRGGAINIGWIDSTDTTKPQLDFRGTATFADNYTWALSTRKAFGGALSIMTSTTDPDGVAIAATASYNVVINKGCFHNNMSYSESSIAHGGAIYNKTYNAKLSLGSGSCFTGNLAKSRGGAIYFDQGTLNLTGNVEFQGNRHEVSFSTSSGRPLPVSEGVPNAIYFGLSNNPATLNLDTAGEWILFHDPISSPSGGTVFINKTGAGEVIFYTNNSDIQAQVAVLEGAFILADGAGFGRIGTATNNSMTVSNGALLQGDHGSVLRTLSLTVSGTLQAVASNPDGVSTFGLVTKNNAAVTLDGSAALSLVIKDKNTFSQINLDGAPLTLAGATLAIDADGYVPSADLSDRFVLVSNLATTSSGQFAQGASIDINGAEFAIVYDYADTRSIYLQQMTAPVPSAPTIPAIIDDDSVIVIPDPTAPGGIVIDGEISADPENTDHSQIFEAAKMTVYTTTDLLGDWTAAPKSGYTLNVAGDGKTFTLTINPTADTARFYRVATTLTAVNATTGEPVAGDTVTYNTKLFGQYKVTVPAGQRRYVVNQLADGASDAVTIFNGLAVNSTIVVTDLLGNTNSTYKNASGGGRWMPTTLTFPLGAIAQVYNSGSSDYTATFVGTVPTAQHNIALQNGQTQLVGSLLPLKATTVAFGVPATIFDVVTTYRSSGLLVDNIYLTQAGGRWQDGAPTTINIGEGFLLKHMANMSWRMQLTTDSTSLAVTLSIQ